MQVQISGKSVDVGDSLRSHMHMLRKSLTAAGGHDPVETLHGIGYRLNTGIR